MSATSSSILLQNCLDRLRGRDGAARDEILRLVCGRVEHLARRMRQAYPVASRLADTDDIRQGVQMRLWKQLQRAVPESSRHLANLLAEMVRGELIDLTRHYYRA